MNRNGDYDEFLKMLTDNGFGKPRINGAPDVGWWPLINDLLKDLQFDFGLSSWNMTVLQIKEKFGGLRFYVSFLDDDLEKQHAAHLRIQRAEGQSYKTCERCGQPGELREGNWLKTLCDEHADGRAVTSPI